MSPNLVGNLHWSTVKGFRLDVHRLFATSWFNTGNNPQAKLANYAVQLRVQVQAPDPMTGKVTTKRYAEYDPVAKQFIWNPIDYNNNYSVEFKPPVLQSPAAGATLSGIEICCWLPGYVGKLEAALGGPWLIGNVCPVK